MRTDETVYLIYKRTPICRETGYKAEIQAFVDSKPIDNVELTNESREEVVCRYREQYNTVYVNGNIAD